MSLKKTTNVLVAQDIK